MADTAYTTKDEALAKAREALDKTLRDLIPSRELPLIEEKLRSYAGSRKGYLGELIEQYHFGVMPNSRPGPDLMPVGVELKTTPLKRSSGKKYVSKERLVFSMINYDTIIGEKWETSSFLAKNKLLLIMMYLFDPELLLIDWEFKFVHLLDLLGDISPEDVAQIRDDWQFIVDKVRRGDAHLLSEADTFYLGAVTKAQNSKVLRDQPSGERIPAKPRAFSLKQSYLNYLIQTKFLGNTAPAPSIFSRKKKPATIEEQVSSMFAPYIGKSRDEIMDMLGWHPEKQPKNFHRILVNRMLGAGTSRVLELEKANITLRVLALEHTGTLRESISFPAFDYKDIVRQRWYDEEDEVMADFHAELEQNKFLFAVFQKRRDGSVFFKKFGFWNFPMNDLSEAQRVWEKTVETISEGNYRNLPGISDSPVAHVRPHGKNSSDKAPTPQGTMEIKRSFWLNAKYVQKALESL